MVPQVCRKQRNNDNKTGILRENYRSGFFHRVHEPDNIIQILVQVREEFPCLLGCNCTL